MKRLFSLAVALIIGLAGFSQSKLYIRGDTINIRRDGGNANVVIDSIALIRKSLIIGAHTSAITAYKNNSHLVIGDSATTKGLIIPRVQTTAAITDPKQGMIVYSISDSKFYYRTLTEWVDPGSSGQTAIFETVADLKAAPVNEEGAIVLGIASVDAGDGGEYYWDLESSASGDDYLVIDPPGASGTGRYHKIFKGRTRATEFNIKATGVSQTTLINAAIANATVKELVFDEPSASYAFNGKIDFNGKTISFFNGAQLVSDGSTNDTVYNALVVADPKRKIFGTSLAVKGLHNAVMEGGWFGMTNDAVYLGPTPTDNYPLLVKAALAGQTSKVHIPASTSLGTSGYWYSFSSRLVQSTRIELFGDNGTVLIWPGSEGIKFAWGSGGSYIHDISLRGNYASTSGAYNSDVLHGIEINSNITVERVSILGFSGDNIRIFGDVGGSPYTNANNAQIKDCYLFGAGRNNLTLRGGDANNCFIHVDATAAAKFNISDSSFLGNYFQACHTASASIDHPLNQSVVSHGGFYWISIADSGPASTIVEPGVTSGWASYWVQKAFSPPFSTVWTSGINFYVGCVGYYFQGANQYGLAAACYAEQDQIVSTNNSNTLFVAGFLAGLGGPGSIAHVNGWTTTGRYRAQTEVAAGDKVSIGDLATTTLNGLEVNKTAANAQVFLVNNNASSQAIFSAFNSALTKSVRNTLFGSGYGSSGIEVADHAAVYAVGTSLDVGTYAGAHYLTFWTNNTPAGGFNPSGNLYLSAVPAGATDTDKFIVHNGGTNYLETRTGAQVLSDIGAAASSHTHGTGDITSGVFLPAFLGTGTASAATHLTGASTWAKFMRNLVTNVTDVGNVGGGSDDLMVYAIPAAMLATDGDYLEFTMSFTLAANANSKEIQIYYGATNIIVAPAQVQNGGTVEIKGTVVRTGATTQDLTVTFISTNAGLYGNGAYYSTATETLSSGINLKATVIGVADNDIIQKILIVKYVPVN